MANISICFGSKASSHGFCCLDGSSASSRLINLTSGTVWNVFGILLMIVCGFGSCFKISNSPECVIYCS